MIYSVNENKHVPLSPDGEYSKGQILRLLLEWIEDRHPYMLFELSEINEKETEKAFARKILFLRLQREPAWLYLLPESILLKIGVQIDQAYAPDPKIKSLMETLRTNKVKKLDFKGFKNPSDIVNHDI